MISGSYDLLLEEHKLGTVYAAFNPTVFFKFLISC